MIKQYNPYQRRVPAGNRDGGRWDSDGISNEGPSLRAMQRVRTKPLAPIKKPKPIKAPRPLKAPKPRELSHNELTRLQAIDPPIKPVYPLENILGAVAGVRYIGRIIQEAASYVVAEKGLAALAASRALAQSVQIADRTRFRNAKEYAEHLVKLEDIVKGIRGFLGGRPTVTDRNKHGDLYMIRDDKKVRFDIKNTYPHPEPHFHIEKKTPFGNWRPTAKQRYPFKDVEK